MAELVDAVDSKSTDRKVVRVQVPFSAPQSVNQFLSSLQNWLVCQKLNAPVYLEN